MKITGAEAIWHCLLKEGVDVVFGYPGGAIMPAYDALVSFENKIRHVLVRHEQGASHAAEGYARVTGRAGVCIATSGPGATNLVTGIADAMMDSVPIVCITGQVFKHALGTDAFQETDVIGVTMPITKWNFQVTDPNEIPEAIAKAFYIAQNGRPGPVVIDITKNAQVETFEYTPKSVTQLPNFDPRPEPEIGKLKEAAEIINNAKKPYMLIGHGILISRAHGIVKQFIEKTGIPVASTLHGLSALPVDHPLYVGMLGMHGNYGPSALTNSADVIIAAGMRFDDRVTGKLATYAPNAKIIHIDIDAAELDKSVRTVVGINADAREALEKLLPLVRENEHPQWLEEFRKCDAIEVEKVIHRDLNPTNGKISMGEVVDQISKKTNGEAVVVADVGQHQMMAARYYRFKKPDSFISSGGLGTMGFALPAAMGAQMGAPDRQVVVICGDGGFQMTLQELGTIKQEGLPIKTVILNNNFLGMVRQWQELFFESRYSQVYLNNPDFVKLGEAFGIKSRKITSRSELSGALDEMFASKEPYLLEVVVEKEENVFPMIPAGASVTDIRLE